MSETLSSGGLFKGMSFERSPSVFAWFAEVLAAPKSPDILIDFVGLRSVVEIAARDIFAALASTIEWKRMATLSIVAVLPGSSVIQKFKYVADPIGRA